MAGLAFVANTGQIATGTALKTLLQIVAASNHRVLLWEWSISFTGISNTAVPILVQVMVQTTAGTMTALALVKECATDSETLQTTAAHTATGTEPTASDVKFREQIHPQGGYTWPAPFAKPIPIPGGTRLGFTVTAAADVNAVVRARLEE
jgi:hypothetical protein